MNGELAQDNSPDLNQDVFVQDNSVPGTSGIVKPESNQKKRGRQKVRRDRAACYRENQKLKMKIEKLKRNVDKYKKKMLQSSAENCKRKQGTHT